MNELIPLAMLALVAGMFGLLGSVARDMVSLQEHRMNQKRGQARPDSNNVAAEPPKLS